MRFRLPKIMKSWYFAAISLGVILILALAIYTFFWRFSKSDTAQCIYIDTDDTIDSIYNKVAAAAQNERIHGFKILSRYSRYSENIHTGAYSLETSATPWSFLRRLRRGEQQPVMITIPSVRTLEKLSGSIGQQLMLDSLSILSLLTDSAVCAQYGFDTATIACMIIPNTYEMYWNISPTNLMNRLKTEHELFWNAARKRKAADLKMTPLEVSTLASIVEEETANDGEKPTIAGLYYNRLLIDMPLQADPTVIFANNSFGVRRVYAKDLNVDSPYNTYKHKGLPPGPIRIPSTVGLDAVLNMQHHNYIYMCAKEDFSGTHNFSTTYAEHKENARRYTRALNERGIK